MAFSGCGLVAEQVEGALQQRFDAVLDVVDHVRDISQGGVRAAPRVDTRAVVPGIEVCWCGLGTNHVDLFGVRVWSTRTASWGVQR